MKDNEKVTYSFFSCLKTVHLPTIPNCDAFQVELLGPAIDHLFSMCCMQYRYVLQTKMKVDNANGKEVRIVVNYFVLREQEMQEILQVMRLLQYLTMVLMSLYGHRELVKRASSAVT